MLKTTSFPISCENMTAPNCSIISLPSSLPKFRRQSYQPYKTFRAYRDSSDVPINERHSWSWNSNYIDDCLVLNIAYWDDDANLPTVSRNKPTIYLVTAWVYACLFSHSCAKPGHNMWCSLLKFSHNTIYSWLRMNLFDL